MTCALIAGRGRLPEILAQALAREGAPVVYALEGQVPDLTVPVRPFRIETLGTVFDDLRRSGIAQVCLAGAIHRPRIDPGRIDAATLPLVERMTRALSQGDDGALRAALRLFEDAGFSIKAADAIMPGLLPDPGVPTVRQPDPRDRSDAARGFEVIEILGAADVGQACAVAARQVLAVEATPGTDAMLAGLRDRPPHLPSGGVLCKAPKPGQDRRVDLPTIGVETVHNAAAAGLNGIVVAARGVLVLDASDAIAEADSRGMFIWIRES